MSLHKVKSTCVLGNRPWADVGGGGQSSGFHGQAAQNTEMGVFSVGTRSSCWTWVKFTR